MNLYEETVKKLETHGKSFNDVIAIRGTSFQITKEEFLRLSKWETLNWLNPCGNEKGGDKSEC